LSSPTGNPGSNGQRVAAVERLKAAVAERKQVIDQREASKGTGRDIEVAVTVKAADEQVDARQRWLSWVDRDKE
jgi:hypothetical protein